MKRTALIFLAYVAAFLAAWLYTVVDILRYV